MPPDAAPLSVSLSPSVNDVLLTVELFTSVVAAAAFTVRVKFFVAALPAASLIITRASYVPFVVILRVPVVAVPFFVPTVVHVLSSASLY